MWAVSSGPNGERDAKSLPLYAAIIAQDLNKSRQLLDQGESPDALLSQDRWSPLMIASAEGDIELARLLVERRANLNFTRCYPVAFSPLAVALEYDIPRQDFTIFNYLLTAGADINATCADKGDSIERDPNGNAYAGNDIAKLAATLGQMAIVNQLLDNGYRRDIPELLIILKIRLVDRDTQPDKDKAIARVMAILAGSTYRQAIPSLLDHLKKLVANERVVPWDENSAFKDPEKDFEVIQLERILKAGKTQ